MTLACPYIHELTKLGEHSPSPGVYANDGTQSLVLQSAKLDKSGPNHGETFDVVSPHLMTCPRPLTIDWFPLHDKGFGLTHCNT